MTMAGRRLFIFVEGSDDVRFFENIIQPRLVTRYESVQIVTYACTKSVKVDRFLRGIKAMNHDYIVVADIDQEPSATMKKRVITTRFDEVETNRIMVIIMEIESWYLAGIDASSARAVGIRPPGSTDHVTKEEFNRVIPRYYPSKVAFMIELLRHFSISTAADNNRSFRYFTGRYMVANPEDSPLPPGV